MSRLKVRLLTSTALGAVALVATTGAVFAAGGGSSLAGNDWPYAGTSDTPVLAAVGDIACEPGDDETNANVPASFKCGSPTLGGMDAQFATADQIESMKPDLVALLGAYGAMKFTLGHNSYSWDYQPVLADAGQPSSVLDYSDTGSAKCHGAPTAS
jgi:hypothetical protein